MLRSTFAIILLFTVAFKTSFGQIEGFPISNCQFANCLQASATTSAITPTIYVRGLLGITTINTCNHTDPRQQFAFQPAADGRIVSIYNPTSFGVGNCLTVGTDPGATSAPNDSNVTLQPCTVNSTMQQWDQELDQAFWYEDKIVCLKYKNRGSGLCLASDSGTRTYAYTCGNQFKNEFFHYPFALCPQ